MKLCLNCSKQLTGRQAKFCCLKCKNTHNNYSFQSYQTQQKRGLKRKLDLLKAKGGKCEICSYEKNHAALCFHHLDETTKEFQLTLRECSNHSLEKLLKEAEKCQLLCHNCHMEVHYPYYNNT